MKFSGGDLAQNGCFQMIKLANVGRFSDFFMGRQLGGDASENGDFQRGKQRLQGRKNFQINFDEFLGTSFSGANVGGRC